MNPSYARIRLPLTGAVTRFAQWIGLPELAPPTRLEAMKAVDQACDGDEWRGVAVFVHEKDGWTIFDDLSGHLASYRGTQWAELARNDELVVAGYNDAIPYAQLIVVRDGQVVREFLEDLQDPHDDVNVGRLDFEEKSPIEDWTDAALFVDEDELADQGADEGLLWMFKPPPG